MKKRIIALLLVVIAIGAVIFWWPRNSCRRTLPDGTVFVLSGVKIGSTNSYTQGSLLSKTLGRLVPAKGMAIAGVKITPPRKSTYEGQLGADVLTAQINLLNLLSNPPMEEIFLRSGAYHMPWPQFGVQIVGDDGIPFDCGAGIFGQDGTTISTYAVAQHFPRDSKQFHFRIIVPGNSTNQDDRTCAVLTTFTVDNPKAVLSQRWQAEHSPPFKLANGLQVEIGEITVKNQRPSGYPWAISRRIASLPIRVAQHGVVVTNWGIREGSVLDASGNIDQFDLLGDIGMAGFALKITNDWVTFDLKPLLNPVKVWKFKAHFTAEVDFPSTNLFSFTVTSPSSANWNSSKSNIFHTTTGLPIIATFPQTNILEVQLPTQPAGLRLNFVTASDDEGHPIEAAFADYEVFLRHPPPSAIHYKFRRELTLTKSRPIRVTIAIHEDYEAEFTVQPKFVDELSP